MLVRHDTEAAGAWSPATSAVELSLIDGFDLRCDGRSIPVKSRKACAILAYLALSATGHEPRERVSGLLWSESSEPKARASLRQVLHGLQSDLNALGLPLLSLSRKLLAIDRRWLGLDTQVLEEDLRYGVVGTRLQALDPVPQALCADLDGLDPAFDVWLNVQREMMQRRLVGGLERIMERPGKARVAATAILALDPTHEAACRALMCRHARDGDVAAALRVYNELWDLLERDYDSEPSPETKDLVVAIKMERLPAADVPQEELAPRTVAERVHRPPPGDPLTSITVSRFDLAGVPEELVYVADGLRHEIVASLVRFREWSVMDGEGVGSGEGHPSLTRYSLDGTIRHSQTSLFVTLTVKQRPAGRYIWSEAFEFKPERWLEARTRLVGRIAVALNVRLSSQRSRVEGGADEVSPSSYDLWLRGHQLLSSWRIADRQRASDMLLRVLIDAPDFAPAYGSLVRLHNSEHIVRPGIRREPARAEEALRFARIGAKLDPLNSRAHLGLAWSMAMSGRHDEAEATFRDAIELNENDTWTIVSAGQGLAFCGCHAEALHLADRVLEIDPGPTPASWGYQVGIRYLACDYERALDAARRAGDVISNLPGWKAAVLARLGRIELARAEMARFTAMIRATWQSTAAATDAAIGEWFLGSFPIRREADLGHLRDGLAAAGMEVGKEGN